MFVVPAKSGRELQGIEREEKKHDLFQLSTTMPGKKRSSTKQKNKTKRQPQQPKTCALDPFEQFEVYCDAVEAQLEDERSQRRKEKQEKKAKKAKKDEADRTTLSPVLGEMATNVSDQEREIATAAALKRRRADALLAEPKKTPLKTLTARCALYKRKVEALTDDERRLQKEIRSATSTLRSTKREQARVEALEKSASRARVQQRDALLTETFLQQEAIARGNAELIETRNMIAAANLRNAEMAQVFEQLRLQHSCFPPEEREKIRKEDIRLNAENGNKDGDKNAGKTYQVEVPVGVQPGQQFAVLINEQQFLVVCPAGATTGMSLHIRVPDATAAPGHSSSDQGEVKTATETPTKNKNELKNSVLLAAGLSPMALPPPVATCVICMANPSTRLFVPCGHFCVCGPCALRYHESRGETSGCPICRKKYTGVIQMYKQ